MPMANTKDTASPLGMSVYSRATKLIADADKQYERLLWEFESGERALYVSEEAFRRDKNGNRVLPNARLYKLLNCENDELFKDWTPSIRESEIIAGLDDILRKIEFNCGLAYGTLSNVQNVDKTAEEIRASKQRSYSTVAEIQNSLRNALSGLVKSMNVLCDLYELAPDGEYSVSLSLMIALLPTEKQSLKKRCV